MGKLRDLFSSIQRGGGVCEDTGKFRHLLSSIPRWRGMDNLRHLLSSIQGRGVGGEVVRAR